MTDRVAHTQISFIEAVKLIHFTEDYDYSETIFTTLKNKIKVICKIHGAFITAAISHLNGVLGSKCPICRNRKKSSINLGKRSYEKYTEESYVAKVKTIHGDNRYDYSEINFLGINHKITVSCWKHGDKFTWYPSSNDHLYSKSGCPKCHDEERSGITLEHRAPTKEEFLVRCQASHGDQFDYTNSIYTHSKELMTISCKVPGHGDFQTTPNRHTHITNPVGCPKCSPRATSKAEVIIANKIRDLGIEVIQNSKKEFGIEIDIFLPKYNLGFEYNGVYWHSDQVERLEEKDLPISKTYAYRRHLQKTEIVEKAGAKLVHIWEDDWLDRPEVTWRWIQDRIGINQIRQPGARKFEVKRVDNNDLRTFISERHIQGFGSNYEYCYGLYDENEILAAAMTFGTKNCKQGIGEVALERFCSSGYIPGGFTKLLANFIKDFGQQFQTICSFADRSWTNGDVYSKNGFTLVEIQPPDYMYCKNQGREHKRNFQRKYLEKRLKNFDPNLSERINCRNHGYYRIWDCGLTKWELKIPK